MNVCKAVSQRAVSWNSNAKTASIQLLKFGCNVVIFKSCLQAIDILVTATEILISKIKAVAALNLLSFGEKEWAALLQSQLFYYQNKQKQHWELQICHWTESCTAGFFFLDVSNIFFSALKMFYYLLYCLLSTGIWFISWLLLVIRMICISLCPEGILTSCSQFLPGQNSPLDFPPHLHSWQWLDWFSLFCALSISAASCLNLLIKMKFNSAEKYLLP